MKTQIVQLEPFDDIISARDKINWNKAERLLLVWPEHTVILNRRLDLVLLRRHCQAIGTQLILVTSLEEVHAYANELKIPYFIDLKRAQNAYRRLPRRFRLWIEQPADILPRTIIHKRLVPPPRNKETLPLTIRLSFFSLAVLAVLTMAAGILPGAQITMNPRSDVQEITFDVQADPDLFSYNLSGVVPARPLSIVVEGRDTQPTSGTARFPYQAARGQVVFTNLTDAPVPVPKGTVVRSTGDSEYRFSVLNSGTVPVSETIILPVEAILPGPTGNQPANRLIAIEGNLGTQLGVTNPQALKGGNERQSPVPTDQDRQVLQIRLTEALYASALAELMASLADGDILLESTVQLSRILENSFEPTTSTPADQLSLNLRLEFTAFIVKKVELDGLAEAVLDANLPAGYSPLPGTLKVYSDLTDEKSKDETIWQLTAQRQIITQLNQSEVIRSVLGRPAESAKQQLWEQLPLSKPPQIAVSPGWWPRLPILPLRIHITQVEVHQP